MTPLPVSAATTLFSALVLLGGHHAYRLARGRQTVRRGVARFNARPPLNSFNQTRPRLNFGPQRQPHAVLLLHGFSGSAGSFKHLCPLLDAAGIPYYAPNFTGCGIDNGQLLEGASAADWLRDADEGYDLLAQVAENISIVGFSFGSRVACDLAMRRPIAHLVLAAPYFYLKNPPQLKLSGWVRRPWLRRTLELLMPYVGKPQRHGEAVRSDLRDPAAAATLFAYPVVPLRALAEAWSLPTVFDFKTLRYDSLTVLHGLHDGTSDVPPFLAELAKAGVAADVHAYSESGHNLLDDYDHQAVVATILKVLKPG